jgi:competence protein ComEC
VLCVFARDVHLRPGDTVRAFGRLTARAGSDATPAVVDVPEGALLEVVPARSLATATEALRLHLHAGLVAAVPGRAGRLLALLVLGHGGAVDDDLAEAHRATGLSHLLAVSGAHVSLLAGMLSLLAHRGRRAARPPWTVLAAVALYGAVTGLDPPVVRALVAFALLLAARRAGRHLPAVAALAAPGILTAVLVPADTTTASFALSYAAVAGLALTPTPASPRTLPRIAGHALLASAWATLTTAPFTLHLFGQVAPWTILATPLLAPLVAVMLALGLVVAALAALGAATAWIALPLGLLAEAYAGCVEALAQLPGAPLVAACRPPLPLLCACAVVALAPLLARPSRRTAAAACLALVLPHFLPWPPAGPPRLLVLDVGHGQACWLQLQSGASVLVDCGSQGSPRRAADAVLRALAPRRRIDLLVLTHGDADHMNGVAPLLRRVAVGRVVLPSELGDGPLAQAIRRAGIAVVGLGAGERAEPLPGLTVARPGEVDSQRSNDRGLWASADLGGLRVLLPGDAEEAAVEAWLTSPHASPADVLLLPHHGRRHDAIGPLLARVAPTLALVSGGSPARSSPSAAAAAGAGSACSRPRRSATSWCTRPRRRAWC